MNWKTINTLLMLEQTLFGLPWAILGALFPFASSSFIGPHWFIWVFILLAFIFARVAGMSLNRLIDCRIDFLNPRTRSRPLPSGQITKGQVQIMAILSLVLFIISCSLINFYTLLFSPLIAFLLIAYSYTKRFTYLCHFVLGLIEFFAPFLGYVAITGKMSIAPVYLGAAIFFWISGVDIMYSTQDRVFDLSYGLKSMPVKIGEKNSFIFARFLHVASVLGLILAGVAGNIAWPYYLGIFIVGWLFIYQHQIVKTDMYKAFFVSNSLIAVVLLLFTLGAILWVA